MKFCMAIVRSQPELLAFDGRSFRKLSDSNLAGCQSIRALISADQGTDESGHVVRGQIEDAFADLTEIDRDDIEFLPLVSNPSKILCVGRNYAEHAIEQQANVPSEPLIFAKSPSALAAHLQPVTLPGLTDQVDYEAELVVVIGRRARHVQREHALNYVAGYTCGNDITARDWQKGKPGQQWFLGKSFDTFAPVGPFLTMADDVDDPQQLRVQMILNGTVVQEANTDQMIFPIDFLVSYVSQVMTLEPGDLLFTGTPGGVGFAKNPPQFLKQGDEMTVEIDEVGRLTNAVGKGVFDS